MCAPRPCEDDEALALSVHGEVAAGPGREGWYGVSSAEEGVGGSAVFYVKRSGWVILSTGGCYSKTTVVQMSPSG